MRNKQWCKNNQKRWIIRNPFVGIFVFPVFYYTFANEYKKEYTN